MRSHRNQSPTNPLGEAVRARRKLLRLTQRHVADLAGCAELFVREVEAGKPTVRLDKLVDVLTVLGLRLTLESGRDGIRVSDDL
jgi:HTH-type transcriptional regulator / antitoxin HipB